MSVVALVNTCPLVIIHLPSTDRWKMEKTTTENDNLNRKLRVEKREYEIKCTSTIEPV